MTLIELIRTIESVAVGQPAVSSIVRGDIRKLNSAPNARYGAFGWVQGTHSASAAGDGTRYAFSLFYVDRLTADKSNATEITSVGCEVLGAVLRYMSQEVCEVSDWTLHPFTYRFKDECAGVWAEVEFVVPTSTPCGRMYDFFLNIADFNADFNEDFQCWVLRIEDREIQIY